MNTANSSETETLFWNLHLSILDEFISGKIYAKRDDFDYGIMKFPYLDWDVPRRASYGVNDSQLIPSRGLNMSCVYHGRTNGRGCGHVKSI